MADRGYRYRDAGDRSGSKGADPGMESVIPKPELVIEATDQPQTGRHPEHPPEKTQKNCIVKINLESKLLFKYVPDNQAKYFRELLTRCSSSDYHLSSEDLAGLGMPYSNYPQQETAKIFHTTLRQLSTWGEKGLPKNIDKTYNLYSVHEWLIKYEKQKWQSKQKEVNPDDLSTKKTMKEIEYKDAQIMKIKKEYMLREECDMILSSRAGSLRTFLEKSVMKLVVHLVGRSMDELRAIMWRWVQECIDAYMGNSSRESSPEGDNPIDVKDLPEDLQE